MEYQESVIPEISKEVVKVTPLPASLDEILEEIVAFGIHPDLGGYWDGEEGCWYLWSLPGVEPNWKTHWDCIQRAGGHIEWIRPEPRNVNPSGQASIRWHISSQ